MKYKFILLLLLFSVSIVFGQSEETSKVTKPVVPKQIIKVSTLTMGQLYTPAIQFAYERQLKNRWAWQAELGYINDFNYIVSDEQLNGFRSRFELRKYRRTYSNMIFYMGIAGQFKQTFAKNEELFWRYDQSYLETVTYQRWTTSGGLFFTNGFQAFYENGTSLEAGMLYGFRMMNRTYRDIPEDAQVNFQRLGFREGLHFFPAVFPVLKFGMAL